jgi:hypothetical protein
VGKVLSAQGSGYYPSCITSGTEPELQNNLVLTIEQGMALYWRTKKWTISASGSFISNNFGEPIVVSGGGEATLLTPIDSEEALVCSGEYGFGVYGDLLMNGFPMSYEVYWDFYFYGKKSNNNFYPYFDYNSVYIQNNNSREDQKIGIFRFLFNGYTITKNLYTDTAEPPYSGTSGNVQIDLTCTEYWSYGGTYDTSTGNPL